MIPLNKPLKAYKLSFTDVGWNEKLQTSESKLKENLTDLNILN